MIDKAIELSEKRTELLKEYKESLAYEDCDYDVQKVPGEQEMYMLYDKNQQCVRDGAASYVKSWLNRRKIPNNKVYNYKILEQ